ncbi:hypothetical protein SALBM311S_11660 [Streptomyces alboniger]
MQWTSSVSSRAASVRLRAVRTRIGLPAESSNSGTTVEPPGSSSIADRVKLVRVGAMTPVGSVVAGVVPVPAPVLLGVVAAVLVVPVEPLGPVEAPAGPDAPVWPAWPVAPTWPTWPVPSAEPRLPAEPSGPVMAVAMAVVRPVGTAAVFPAGAVSCGAPSFEGPVPEDAACA